MRGGNGNDTLLGWSGDDQLFGDLGDDVLEGGSGNDTLMGGAGSDALYGGADDDLFVGLLGADTIDGGSGFDTLDYASASAALAIDLATHVFTSGNNSAVADGIEAVIGSNYNDTFFGDSAANAFYGGRGDDVFRSKLGADTLNGGTGKDTFVFLKKDVISEGQALGTDVIEDLSAGDRIDVSDFFKGREGASVADNIKLEFDGARTMLSVKVQGAFVEVAALNGDFSADAAGFAAGYVLAA